MATLKYSRQRACIKDYLLKTHEHPTADTVYLHVKEEFPNISLGTVYRNLNLLASMGEAQKIPTPCGGDRFDGRTDLELSPAHITEINQLAERHFNGRIHSHSMIFNGLCPNCLKKNIK